MAKQIQASRANPRNDLTAQYVRLILSYSKATGDFVWKERLDIAPHARARFLGKIAGGIDRRGYRKILIDGKSYTGGRLAWLYVTGQWPENHIDHKNLIRSDNRWRNLRDATIGLNGRNTRVRVDSKSGVKNVRETLTSGKWIARIRHNGAMRHVGVFPTKRQAHLAVRARAKKLFGGFYNPG